MAFVYRSSTRENFLDLKPLHLGPGEYDSEISKSQAKFLHQKAMKYSKIIKDSTKHPIIPFNSTSQRSSILKLDNYIPGPGTYTLSKCRKKSCNNNSLSAEKEILDIISIDSQNSNIKGFLSSERRFNSSDVKNNVNNSQSPGPGSYELQNNYNFNNKINNKFLNGKYAQNKGKIYTFPGSSDIKISSIPDKTKGKFKIIKGILTEIKNSEIDKNLKNSKLGPGSYNLFQKWETNGVMWSKGYQKEEKSKINESKIQKELEQNSTMLNTENYSEKMHNFNTSKISSSFKENFSKNKNESSQLTKTINVNNPNNICNKIKNININGWNTATNLNYKNKSLLMFSDSKKPQVGGLIRNKVFHSFLKNREEIHLETVTKNNYNNNLMLDIEYTNLPGPGFYNQNIIPKHIDFTSTTQNFGSNSPKNADIKKEYDILGPGTYFKERNKYEPKFKTVLHIKLPEKPKDKKEKSVYLNNLIKKNKEKNPGPGQYNLEGELIKKEISNNKSFGSNVERFHGIEIKDKTVKRNNSKYNNNIKLYINQFIKEENIKNIQRNKKIKYLTKKEKDKKKERLKRQQYVNKPIPSVGTYSPEITSSIYYNVFSKLNPYRNSVAPFNMINTRFSQVKNPRLEIIETPGPADYDVLPAFKALNEDRRKYNIFGQNEQREFRIKNTDVPGPGLYNLDNPDIWNRKTYNVLFINNNINNYK